MEERQSLKQKYGALGERLLAQMCEGIIAARWEDALHILRGAAACW